LGQYNVVRTGKMNTFKEKKLVTLLHQSSNKKYLGEGE